MSVAEIGETLSSSLVATMLLGLETGVNSVVHPTAVLGCRTADPVETRPASALLTSLLGVLGGLGLAVEAGPLVAAARVGLHPEATTATARPTRNGGLCLT